MNRHFFHSVLFLTFNFFNSNYFAQPTKVAILDFENTSGKTEYDALAKAISSMLITDLANNIHPKKVEFFERSQLNKLLDEQKLQKSKNFDAKTAVDFGKLSGVNYVFVGSVFVLDGTCNFSSKLVDVQTSKILLAKEVSGTIVNFLQLKSQLAEAIAIQLNNPITLDPSYKDQSTTLSTINQYGKILTTMDQGDVDKAEQLREMLEETNPDFKYFKDLRNEISLLKEKLKLLEEKIDDAVENPYGLAVSLIEENNDLTKAKNYLTMFLNRNDYYSRNFPLNKKIFVYFQFARIYKRKNNYKIAFDYLDSCLQIDPYYLSALAVKFHYLIEDEKFNGNDNLKSILEISNKILSYSRESSKNFNSKVYRSTYLNDNGDCLNYNDLNCDFYSISIKIPKENGGTVFDLLDKDWNVKYPAVRIAIVSEVVDYLISKEKFELAQQIIQNSLGHLFKFYSDNLNIDSWGYVTFNNAFSDNSMNFNKPCERSLFENSLDDKSIFVEKNDEIYRHIDGNYNFYGLMRTYSYLKILNGNVTDAITILNYYLEILNSIDKKSENNYVQYEKYLIFRSLNRISLILNDDFNIDFNSKFKELSSNTFVENTIKSVFNVANSSELILSENTKYLEEITNYRQKEELIKLYYKQNELKNINDNKLTFQEIMNNLSQYEGKKVFLYCKYYNSDESYNNYSDNEYFKTVTLYTEKNELFESEKKMKLYISKSDSQFYSKLREGQKLSICIQLDLNAENVNGYVFYADTGWHYQNSKNNFKKFEKLDNGILSIKKSYLNENQFMLSMDELNKNKSFIQSKQIFIQSKISNIDNLINDYYSYISLEVDEDEKYQYPKGVICYMNKKLFQDELAKLKVGDTLSFVLTADIKNTNFIGVIDLLDFGKVDFQNSKNNISKVFELGALNTLDKQNFEHKLYTCLSTSSEQGHFNCYEKNAFGDVTTFYWYDYIALNNMAWSIAKKDVFAKKELEYAEKIAKRSCEIMFYLDHNSIDTYAYVLKKNNKKDDAKQLFMLAIKIAGSKNDINAVEKYTNRLKELE